VDDTDTYADHDGPEYPPTKFDLDEGDIDPADAPAIEVIQTCSIVCKHGHLW